MDIIRFEPKGTLMTLKRVFKVKRDSYFYSVKNFLLYSMWDITNTPHADTTSSLCLMGLRDQQTNKHPLQAKQTLTLGLEINSSIIRNDLHPTV